MVEYTPGTLDRVFAAVADPTRRAILEVLARKPAPVTEVARRFPVSLNAVSKHLMALERAGLIERDIRGRQHICRVRTEPLGEALKWMDKTYRFWQIRLDALEAHLAAKKKDKMTTASMHPENTVVIRRRIPARREKVYAAWTDPESIKHWMCPGDAATAIATLDVRVGGKVRFVMKSPQRDYIHTGEYLLVEPPSKLVFTWSLGENEEPNTRVTVELEDAGESCELTLTHERFRDAETARRYSGGWDQIAQKLAEYFEQRAGRAEDFRMQLEYPALVENLYEQFATQKGIRNWWTLFCEMQERVGGTASFRFPSADFYAVAKIVRLDPPSCVEWEVTDSKHPQNSGFLDLNDWIGTRIRFDLAPIPGGKSRLRFTHQQLKLKECLGVCTSAWSFYLNESLRAYLETGAGKPHTKG